MHDRPTVRAATMRTAHRATATATAVAARAEALLADHAARLAHEVRLAEDEALLAAARLADSHRAVDAGRWLAASCRATLAAAAGTPTDVPGVAPAHCDSHRPQRVHGAPGARDIYHAGVA